MATSKIKKGDTVKVMIGDAVKMQRQRRQSSFCRP